MDEQTLSLIEALAKLRASSEDLDEIKLAQKKVRTPEGVKKYDQPIGTVITKDMIEQAAKKAASAATESLKSNVAPKSNSGSSSSSSANAPSTTTPKPSLGSTSTKETGVPGNQTSADINNFFVSSYVNNPSKATVGWVEKVDGNWYKQTYENGKITSEVPLDDSQINALVEMEKKGLVYTGHISDPEPETKEQKTVGKLKEAFDSGKTADDPGVQKLLGSFKPKETAPKPEEAKESGTAKTDSAPSAAPKTSEKTVKINGKDVKVGRYSRPKGFAKAFLIVHEDGTVEYENKTGARKKISHNAFDKHQELGMTKFLTSDTGAIKKDQHFEDGKLVNDKASEAAPTAAKVEPMKTPTAEPKSAPAAEKPAQEAPKTVPGGSSLKPETQTKIKFENLDEPKKEAPKAEAPTENKDSESGTVKIGNLTVKPGRYSRPKGFAKAFLIVHKDGTVEYENKKGERKKIGPKSFEGHWNLGMNKFLTSQTRPLKKDEAYENGKLVNAGKDEDTAPKTEQASQPSAAIQAAQKAAEELKAKQDAAKKAEEEKAAQEAKAKKDAEEKAAAEKKAAEEKAAQEAKAAAEKKAAEEKAAAEAAAKKVETVKITLKNSLGEQGTYDIPKDAEIYVPTTQQGMDHPSVIYYPNGDGTYTKVGTKTGIKTAITSSVEQFLADDAIQKWVKDSEKKPEKGFFKVKANSDDPGHDFPDGTIIYVSDSKQGKDTAGVYYALQPDGKLFRYSGLSGLVEKTGPVKDQLLKDLKEYDYKPWDKYHKNGKVEDTSKAGMFYVLIGDKPVHPVPAGTKVYKLGFLEDSEVKAKYYKDDSGSWHVVSATGEYKANSAMSQQLDSMDSNGGLVEDTKSPDEGKAYVASVVSTQTQAEKAVETSEVSTPVASATEVKSVKISGMDIKPGKYSIGKAFAKAFLIVHPDGTAEYMNKSGQTKKLTPAAFKKNWDAGMNKYAGPLEGAKGPAQSEAAPVKTSGLKPGVYTSKAFGVTFDESKLATMEVMEDGSSIFKISGTTVPLNPEQTMDTLNHGNVMDEFGNSVVLPNGAKPKEFHLFGSTKGITLEQLVELRDKVVKAELGVLSALKQYADSVSVKHMLAYSDKYFPNTPDSNKKSLVKAIDDIIETLGNKQAEKPSLADAPTSSKAGFKQDANGNFIKPVVMTAYEQSDFHYLAPAVKNDLIKKISEAVGGKVASAPSKLGSYAKSDWVQAFHKGDFKTMYDLENNAGMKMDPDHPGAPANKDTHKISWAPAVAGELPAGKIPPGEWTWYAYSMSDQEIDNYLIAANAGYPAQMSETHKKYWVKYHMDGNQQKVDSYSLAAKKYAEDYPGQNKTNPPVWTDNVEVKYAYTEYYEAGQQADYWPEEALSSYLKKFPEISEGKSVSNPYNFIKKIDNHVATAKAEAAAKAAAEYAEMMKPKFSKVPGQNVSGGHHEAMVLIDQHGQKWVYKPRDQKDIFLADIEQASHDLAKAWGFKTAKSFITDFDNRSGHVQQMFDAEKDLSGVDVSTLNTSQLQDLAKEHLLDWALDNDDSWGANLLMLKNGSIVGIDKGRAFVGIGHWNGLSGDSSAHVHMPLVYTSMYDAIASKKISQEDANAAYFAAIKQARKMEKLSDARMEEILEEGFKNRKNWTIGGGPSNKEDAIKAAIARKNNLVNDMETLWGNVFKKAGYDKPEAPTNVVTNQIDQDLHLGITPAALEQAKENKSYGISVFMAGPEIEDANLHLFATKDKNGVEMLNGEMKIRESSSAFKKVEKWLKDKAVTIGNAYGFTPTPMKPVLPNEQDYYDKIIGGVKTISTHALDGQYNADKLNGMSWVKNTLQNYVNDYDSKMADEVTQADLVKQYKDPKAFLEMAQTYLGYIAKAEKHKAEGTKSAPGEFSQYVWTPPKEEEPEVAPNAPEVKVELRSASSPKAVTNGIPKLEDDGSLQHHYGYTTDGNPGSMYLVTLPTGETIEFRGNTTGTPAASKGLTRFTMPAGADEAASLERIRAQMAVMGLEMNDATEDDLELFYWRHLAGIMDDRADSKKVPEEKTASSSKYKKFQDAKPIETAKMSAQEELEAWKDAFANITSREQIDEFVGQGGHLPKFGKFHPGDPEKYSGLPYWERFDVTDDMWQSKELLGGSFYTNEAAKYVANTGGMFATETRLRTLGMWQDNMSSTSDMGHGSSQFVFIRQNQEVKPSSADYNLMSIYYSPHILKRTHNYAFAGDLFGEMKSKSTQAHFDFDKLTSHKSGGNEIMVKNAVSLLDDIEIITFVDAAMRDQVIKQYKAMGIDEIRGVPVEKRFVMRNKSDVLEAQKAAKEAWKK